MEKSKIYIIFKFIVFLFVFVILGIAMCYLGNNAECEYVDSNQVLTEDNFTVIIDAGHGGEDCGAIGVNGVYEKDINLAVANDLAGLLKEKGITVITTRTEDKLLYTEAQNIKGQRKQYDLKNRLDYARINPNSIFISIHMNNFEMESCRGMQVIYSTNTAESRILATFIQNSVVNSLQPYNTRKIKATDGSIYLLDNAVGTAVLVECGFLSNREECENLSKKDYQTQLSFSIFCGIMEYIENVNKKIEG